MLHELTKVQKAKCSMVSHAETERLIMEKLELEKGFPETVDLRKGREEGEPANGQT